ncbi:hypothetical protein AA313_de0207169 [Arthrobotrys entomopaga]|nr:hypothetical protein AA313_de0207169 [Arthrobotrys entomopaga]
MIFAPNRRTLTSLISLLVLFVLGINYIFYNAAINDYISSKGQGFKEIISTHSGNKVNNVDSITAGEEGQGNGYDDEDDGDEWCSRIAGPRWIKDLSSTWSISCGAPVSNPDYTAAYHKPKLSRTPGNHSSLLCFQVQVTNSADNFCVARNALYDPKPGQKPAFDPKKDLFPEGGFVPFADTSKPKPKPKDTKSNKHKKRLMKHGRRDNNTTTLDDIATSVILPREEKRKWQLSCSPITEWDRGVLPPAQFPRYFSDTGVGKQLSLNWEMNPKADKPTPSTTCSRSIMVVGLEGNGNIWHTLMEVWSGMLTMDALNRAHTARLRIFPPPSDDNNNNNDEDEDIWHPDNVEVYIEKNMEKEKEASVWFDMWTLVTGKPPRHITELEKGCYKSVILPLAGGANPFWHDHWKERRCTRSSMADEFISKVFNFYDINHDHDDSSNNNNNNARAVVSPPESKNGKEDGVVVRFISRSHNRRILKMEEYVRKLQGRYPNADIDVTRLETLTIRQQLEWARGTDVLVGVIGAGMTHTMFLKKGAAVVELMHPEPFWYYGFANLAKMRGLEYYPMHGDQSRGYVKDWQADDVLVPEVQFMEIMGRAIEGQIARKQREKMRQVR